MYFLITEPFEVGGEGLLYPSSYLSGLVGPSALVMSP